MVDPHPTLPEDLDLDTPGPTAHRPTVPPEVDRVLWTEATRRRALIGLLLISLMGTTVLVLPYAYALLFAVTTVVVAQPLFRRVLVAVGGRRHLAAAASTCVLGALVAFPLGLALLVAAAEFTTIANELAAWQASGGLDAAVAQALAQPEEALGFDAEVAVGDAMKAAVPSVGGLVTTLVAGAFGMLIDVLLYVMTVWALFAEGPRALQAFMRLLPVDDRHAARLAYVFQDMAYSVVVGNLATGVLQGAVAALGYLIAGLPHVALLGVLSVLSSFLPLVGTAIVWVPVTAVVGLAWGWPTALFLALWNLLITGLVDNVARPLFVKGGTDIPSILVFIGLFGGIAWMGMPGLVLGPMIVATTLAVYTIYCEEVLGIRSPLKKAAEQELQAGRRSMRRLRLQRTLEGWRFGR